MNRSLIGLIALALGFGATTVLGADDAKWATIKGRIVWEGAVPSQEKVNTKGVENACKVGKNDVLEEDHVINPKNKGLKDVFVWIRPDGAKGATAFPANLIHPTLAKPDKPEVEIDQPCCRFIPHVLAARAGQKMVIKNSAPFAHNANGSAGPGNGGFNPLIPAGGKFEFARPLEFEPSEIVLSCNLHNWMRARVRVFDHPYFAVTDEDGKFEIKLAPMGQFNLFVSHPATGWLDGKAGRSGKPLNIKGELDLGDLKMKVSKD